MLFSRNVAELVSGGMIRKIKTGCYFRVSEENNVTDLDMGQRYIKQKRRWSPRRLACGFVHGSNAESSYFVIQGIGLPCSNIPGPKGVVSPVSGLVGWST